MRLQPSHDMKSWNKFEHAETPFKPSRTPIGSRALSAAFVAIIVLAALDTIFPGLKWHIPSFETAKDATEPAILDWNFDWSKLEPKEHLQFHKCYDKFECAKLSVPLDWFNGTYPNEKVSIAIIKLPAKVPVDDPRYGGPILLNPGGPGGSGALFAVGLGDLLRLIVDPEVDPNIASTNAKYYDMIGFDPRGIGFTEPAAHCMPDHPSAWSWALRESTEGMLGSSDAALGRLWSMSHAYGTSCKRAADTKHQFDIKQYMATAFVARDMLEIVERHAEWVAMQLSPLSKVLHGRHIDNDHAIPKVHEAKLQYWGFSYGTFLGSTFASMFPDRVGRILLDGVVSSYDYLHSLGNGSLTDNQKVMESFFTYCERAGPAECTLATHGGTSKSIRDRFDTIVQSLYHNPLPINTFEGPEIFTWSDIKGLIFSSLYQPQGVFPLLSRILTDIEAGQGIFLAYLSRGYLYNHVYTCSVDGTNPLIDAEPGLATTAILCGDGIDMSHLTIDGFERYWHVLEDMAPAAGAYWSQLANRCASWKIRASYTFQGPFGGNTSHPILFLSNTADPVTPLRSGRHMHSLFENSGILIQDSAGHCSISTPTPCTLTHIKSYFQTGNLPPPGTLCVPPTSPYSLNSTDPKSPFFDPSLNTTNVVTTHVDELDAMQMEMLEAGRKVQSFVTGNEHFAFQNIFGPTWVNDFIKTAAHGV